MKKSEHQKLVTDAITAEAMFDRELEFDVLACIVFNKNNYSKILLLDSDDFYSLDTKELFNTIRKQYETDKIINLPTVYPAFKDTECYKNLYNRNDVVTQQVDFNIAGLKKISDGRKIQSLSYEATVKISEGQSPINVKEWVLKEIGKV